MLSFKQLLEGRQREKRVAIASRKAGVKKRSAEAALDASQGVVRTVMSKIRSGLSPVFGEFEKATTSSEGLAKASALAKEREANLIDAERRASAKVSRSRENRGNFGTVGTNAKQLAGMRKSLSGYQARLQTETNPKKLKPLVDLITRTHENIGRMGGM